MTDKDKQNVFKFTIITALYSTLNLLVTLSALLADDPKIDYKVVAALIFIATALYIVFCLGMLVKD